MYRIVCECWKLSNNFICIFFICLNLELGVNCVNTEIYKYVLYNIYTYICMEYEISVWHFSNFLLAKIKKKERMNERKGICVSCYWRCHHKMQTGRQAGRQTCRLPQKQWKLENIKFPEGSRPCVCVCVPVSCEEVENGRHFDRLFWRCFWHISLVCQAHTHTRKYTHDYTHFWNTHSHPVQPTTRASNILRHKLTAWFLS